MTRHLLLIGVVSVFSTSLVAQEIVDEWRYTLRRPQGDWHSIEFDDTGWQLGTGGFGTVETPGARIGTRWATNNIWLRKSFKLETLPNTPALLIHHDEDVVIYINGKRLAMQLKGFTVDYKVMRLDARDAETLRVGRNSIAVHCRQTTGGQFVDVHVIDGDNVPTLPSPKRSTKPFQSDLITSWGKEVTAANAWTEYPRPQMRRNSWKNLNGLWDYAVVALESTHVPTAWDGKILVPFCVESKLSGANRLLGSDETLWYRRTFTLADRVDGEERRREQGHTLLHFEAVDYRCEVFVNGQRVGQHVGGNTPFTFDVSTAIRGGSNEIVVRVEDATEEWQLRGKQVINARGIWYTQVSGIWQTVWLEEVPKNYIQDLKIVTDARAGTITVTPEIQGTGDVVLSVKAGGKLVASGGGTGRIEIKVDDAKLWTPEDPFLYDLEVSLRSGAGRRNDTVSSYAGIRSIGKTRDANGHWRFTLNGEPIFHLGPLDQGWWPDGLLTAPSDEAMVFDINWLKKAGFNMIRKHIKVEPRRYYYHCDRIGMMVWQDQVSGGTRKNEAWPEWTRLRADPKDANWPENQHLQFMKELEEMVGTLENHPSIVCWVPFNEAWGQHRTMKVGKWMLGRDPSRLINIASGGNFWPIGDVVDEHRYPHPGFPFELNNNGRFDSYIKVIGEFGGHGLPVAGHVWDANRRNWGYGSLPQTRAEYKARYVKSLNMLNELRAKGIAGGIYTQTTDVEGEINGLMTYDRKVIKIPAAELAELHQMLFEP